MKHRRVYGVKLDKTRCNKMWVSPYFVAVVEFEGRPRVKKNIVQERKEEKLVGAALVVCLANRQLFCKMRCNPHHPHACLPIINVLLN